MERGFQRSSLLIYTHPPPIFHFLDEFAGKNFQAEKESIKQQLLRLHTELLGHNHPDQEDYYMEVLLKLKNFVRGLFGCDDEL